MDRLDRELILSTYHPDAVDDHGMFVGGPEEFADWVIEMHSSTHLSHQHCLFNHSCDLHGNVAHTETYYMFVGMNRQGPPYSISGGPYIDRFEKREGRWAIAARVCVRDWAPLTHSFGPADPSSRTAINGVLPTTMLELVRRASPTRRDRSDLSYARPLTIDDSRRSWKA